MKTKSAFILFAIGFITPFIILFSLGAAIIAVQAFSEAAGKAIRYIGGFAVGSLVIQKRRVTVMKMTRAITLLGLMVFVSMALL